jgi:hypothetical protein
MRDTPLALWRFPILLAAMATCAAQAKKPAVWIYTDMSDKTLVGSEATGTVNDPDDISAMAGYLLMSNEFDTRGIVVASTHRSQHRTSPDQGAWANKFFGDAYAKDLPRLNAVIGGYPARHTFVESCIKKTLEHFDPTKTYSSLANHPTIKSLVDHVASNRDTIHVLIWGSTTEPAILVKHLLDTKRDSLLKRLRFIPHWTAPSTIANCNEDSKGCTYMHTLAKNGTISYHELGSIGQSGIVSGQPRTAGYYDPFKTSGLGKIFVEGKFAYGGVDHSDAATYWTLLGTYGVSLKDIPPNGTTPNLTSTESAFKKNSPAIHEELLRRSKIAASAPTGLGSPSALRSPSSGGLLVSARFPSRERLSLILDSDRARSGLVVELMDLKGVRTARWKLPNLAGESFPFSVSLDHRPAAGIHVVRILQSGKLIGSAILTRN